MEDNLICLRWSKSIKLLVLSKHKVAIFLRLCMVFQLWILWHNTILSAGAEEMGSGSVED